MPNRCVFSARGAALLMIGAAGGFFMTACGGSDASTAALSGRSGAGRGGQRAAVQVEHTATVERIKVPRQVDLSGTLASPDMAKVSSEVSGRVSSVLIELGSIVNQ